MLAKKNVIKMKIIFEILISEYSEFIKRDENVFDLYNQGFHVNDLKFILNLHPPPLPPPDPFFYQ